MERYLLGEFSFTDPEDLNQVTHLYAQGISYPGKMRELQEAIQSRGYKCGLEFAPIPDPKYDWNFTGSYRALQEAAVESALQDQVATVQAPCGTGKTLLLVSTVANTRVQTLILAPNLIPVGQIVQAFKDFTNIEPGIVADGKKVLKPCTVMTTASANAALNNDPQGEVAKFIRSAQFVGVDELHNFAANGGLNVFENLRSAVYLVGWSATPSRIDYRQTLLEAMFGTPTHRITRAQAVENGLNVPLSIYVQDIEPRDFGFLGDRGFTGKTMAAKTKQRNVVYKEYIVFNEERNLKGIAFAKTLVKAGLSVAFICKELAHIEEIVRLAEGEGLDVTPLHGKTPNREEVMDELRDKRIMAVATTLMDQATDVKSLGGVCLMAGGQSYIKVEQRIRCDRIFDGETALGPYLKDRGYVWYPKDHADGLTTHSNTVIKQFKSIVSEHKKHRLLYL